MKVNLHTAKPVCYPPPAPVVEPAKEEAPGALDTAAVLELSDELFMAPKEATNPWDVKYALQGGERARQNAAGKAAGAQDQSGRLTQRLVTATSQDEVRMILSDAYKNLGDMRMEAMTGDGASARKALAAIRRLNKLIRRATRKIGDLNKEDAVRQKQKRAEKQHQEHIVREMKAELHRKQSERKSREKSYLRDAYPQQDGARPVIGVSRAALEAKMTVLSQAIANLSPAEASGTAAVVSAADAGGGEAAPEGEAAEG